MTKARIELKHTGHYFRWLCEVCGETQDKDGMRSEVVFEGLRYRICRDCLEDGKDTASLRARGPLSIVIALVPADEWKSAAHYDTVRDRAEALVREAAWQI